jgi:hypothetical protein
MERNVFVPAACGKGLGMQKKAMDNLPMITQQDLPEQWELRSSKHRKETNGREFHQYDIRILPGWLGGSWYTRTFTLFRALKDEVFWAEIYFDPGDEGDDERYYDAQSVLNNMKILVEGKNLAEFVDNIRSDFKEWLTQKAQTLIYLSEIFNKSIESGSELK